MKVEVINGRKYIRDLLEEACKFFASSLLPKDVIKDLHVEIEMVHDESLGLCFVGDDEEYDPRMFYVQIGKLIGTYNKIKTLAHEMIHVKQHALNELSYLNDECTRVKWHDKIYEKEDIKEIKYWDYPWELECFSKEEYLTLDFCKKKKHNKKSWYKKRYSV